MATRKTPARTSTRQPAKKPAAKAPKAPAARMTLAEVMAALKKAGSDQTRKTYARHGAVEPMFGVKFGDLQKLYKRIRVDHELAMALWDTGNFDARNLAFKVADPALMSPDDLDRWASDHQVRMCGMYVSAIAAEGPHATATVVKWLASKEEPLRYAAWGLVARMAAVHEATPDAWFADRLAEIERTIHAAPNSERGAMNQTLITIGGRSAALRRAALAAAKRIGRVEVDHGETSCKTPEAAPYIEKMWARAKERSFGTPSAHERSMGSPRTRC